jgi:hypothetical protein
MTRKLFWRKSTWKLEVKAFVKENNLNRTHLKASNKEIVAPRAIEEVAAPIMSKLRRVTRPSGDEDGGGGGDNDDLQRHVAYCDVSRP